MTAYFIAGLPPVKVELPVPLVIDLIPLSQPKQRPGLKRQLPGYWVQHETGNPRAGADAEMHNRYLHNGAKDNNGNSQTLSFHFAVDDGVIYQMIPVDEVTWQAADGAGPGNMSGISCELCINEGIDTAKSRHNAEALAGGIMRVLKMNREQVKRHWDFNFNDPGRHHCPDTIMNDNYWPTFVNNVDKVINFVAKPTPAPEPEYPEPGAFDFDIQTATGWQTSGGTDIFMCRFTDLCVKDAIPRVRADSKSAQSGDKIKVRDEVEFLGFFIGADKNGWRILPDGSRVRSSSFYTDLKAKKR